MFTRVYVYMLLMYINIIKDQDPDLKKVSYV